MPAGSFWIPLGRGKRYGNRPGLIHQVVGDWELSATYIAQTGEYLTPTFSGADPSNTRTLGGQADRIANGNLSQGQRSINRWFDTVAFESRFCGTPEGAARPPLRVLKPAKRNPGSAKN